MVPVHRRRRRARPPMAPRSSSACRSVRSRCRRPSPARRSRRTWSPRTAARSSPRRSRSNAMKRYMLFRALASCTSSDNSYIAGFSPPAPAQGYTRFVTPTITTVKPGDNVMYCEWVEAPQDSDRQIVDTLGYQSLGGHPVALYATSEIENVGTSRPCTTRDMLTVTFVGAVGLEGVSAAKLPDGMAFSVPKGFALMTNTHYINTTDKTIEAQSVVDVK